MEEFLEAVEAPEVLDLRGEMALRRLQDLWLAPEGVVAAELFLALAETAETAAMVAAVAVAVAEQQRPETVAVAATVMPVLQAGKEHSYA